MSNRRSSARKSTADKYFKRQVILLVSIAVIMAIVIGVTLYFVLTSDTEEIAPQNAEASSSLDDQKAVAVDGKESSLSNGEIEFRKKEIKLRVGEKTTPEVVGCDISDITDWSSSIPSVATVNENGGITGVGIGVTAITGKVKGTDTLLTLTVNVSSQDEDSEADNENGDDSQDITESGGTENSTSHSSSASDIGGTSSGVTPKGYEIVVKDGRTYVDGILIANKTYTLPEDYDPGVDDEALSAFYEMQSDAAELGLDIYISSDYRSYWTQDRIYNSYVAEDGQAAADTYSSRPGHSDHQTGLTFDLNSIDDSFGYTPESDWVDAHAHEYGFIIRYPKGKEAYTGYKYEPWHIRYIGVEKATKVHESGLSLEEYLGIDSKYSD